MNNSNQVARQVSNISLIGLLDPEYKQVGCMFNFVSNKNTALVEVIKGGLMTTGNAKLKPSNVIYDLTSRVPLMVLNDNGVMEKAFTDLEKELGVSTGQFCEEFGINVSEYEFPNSDNPKEPIVLTAYMPQ